MIYLTYKDLGENCLGRQFAKLSTGLINMQRGNALKISLCIKNNVPFKSVYTSPQDYNICNGVFDEGNLLMWADRVAHRHADLVRKGAAMR